jgi:gas vesicle structural protein
MEPTRDNHGKLADLLDRVLDRGMVLDADIIIYLADVPLVGIKLSAAIAGIETMQKYGLLQDFEQPRQSISEKATVSP